MSFTDDEEILQDFLIEAGEILELLGEQLVTLEHTPQDKELLNAVFRGFHTIKGGAGFLNISNLVEICHRAEDVFNVLRQGERVVDPPMMDVILKVHDDLNSMFEHIRRGDLPPPADAALLERLVEYSKPEQVNVGTESVGGATQRAVSPGGTADAPPETGDATQGKRSSADGGDDGAGVEITDDEFEKLLDELHGTGAHQGVPAAADASGGQVSSPVADAQCADPGGEEITDDEFEALLDQLHGDKAPSAMTVAEPQQSAPEKQSEPTPRAAVIQKKPASESGAVPVTKRTERSPDKATTEPLRSETPGRKEAPQPQAETTVRVDTKRLDDIMNLVGELVLVRNRLSTLESTRVDEDMAKAVANLDLVTADLQTSVMKTRMQPIKKVFGRFPRVVRDLARSLNKEVNLELVGEETDLDKNLVEALADPLVHLVRNAVDHGIEMPDVREKKGKPRVGTVILAAQQEGDHILLTISDDGAGMDANKIRQSAVSKGLMDQDAADRLSEEDCYQLIFAPGFSTKSEISDVSGRGVGMDVVKTKIAQLNGNIQVNSELGRGSTLAIKVPLTLAIMPTLMVRVADQVFALPLGSVVEIFHLDLKKTNVVDGQEVVLIREKALPVFYLRRWLVGGSVGREKQNRGHVVIVNVSGRHIGFVVDQLLGQEEVVIKPLGALLHGTKGLAGATITGDGRISLILDVPGLMAKYAA